jgi:hypothetical protein
MATPPHSGHNKDTIRAGLDVFRRALSVPETTTVAVAESQPFSLFHESFQALRDIDHAPETMIGGLVNC